MSRIFFEQLQLDEDANLRYTTDGYLVAYPRVARSGIQLYKGYEVGRDDLESVRIYRPSDEVFSPDSLHSYAHRPVTNNHPPVPVNSKNWRKYVVGSTGDEVLRDGQFVRVPTVLMDSDVISDYKDGKRQLSLGYTMDLVWGAGVTDDGEKYDAKQTNIRANHLAIVSAARGGPMLKIGDARKCPECGGAMHSGKCEECGYIEDKYPWKKKIYTSKDMEELTRRLFDAGGGNPYHDPKSGEFTSGGSASGGGGSNATAKAERDHIAKFLKERTGAKKISIHHLAAEEAIVARIDGDNYKAEAGSDDDEYVFKNKTGHTIRVPLSGDSGEKLYRARDGKVYRSRLGA